MISESDKFLFRSTIDKKIPIDKDADKEIESNKTNRNRIFDSYSYLSKPNLSGTEPVSYSQSGVSPKTIKKMKQGNLGQPPSIDLNVNHKSTKHKGKIQ